MLVKLLEILIVNQGAGACLKNKEKNFGRQVEMPEMFLNLLKKTKEAVRNLNSKIMKMRRYSIWK